MKTILRFLTFFAAIVAFSSCSKEENMSLKNADNNGIRFHISSPKSSLRAEALTTATIKDHQFKAWGYNAAGAVLEGIAFHKPSSGDDKWDYVNDTEVSYWPDDAVDFYAYAPSEVTEIAVTPSIEKGTQTLSFENKTTAETQKDLVYAVFKGAAKSTYSGPGVPLVFRHALSQVVVQAKSVNENIKVEINQATLAGLQNEGTLTFGSTTTSDTETGASWTLSGDPVAYTSAAPSAPVKLNDSPASVSSEFYVIPQAVKAWGHTASYELAKGFCLKLKGTIKTKDEKTTYWDDKDIYIPLTVNWAENTKYVITVSFGKGGSNSNGGGYQKDGTPILNPIKFTVIVDAYKDGGNQEVDA